MRFNFAITSGESASTTAQVISVLGKAEVVKPLARSMPASLQEEAFSQREGNVSAAALIEIKRSSARL
jgi:hypothetical protein